MKDEYYKKLERKYKQRLTEEQIGFNIEMIASEDEDYIQLFKEGLITKLELIDLLVN